MFEENNKNEQHLFYFFKQIKPLINEILFESLIAYKQKPNIYYFNKMESLKEKVFIELDKFEQMFGNNLKTSWENNIKEINFKNKENLDKNIKYIKETIEKVLNEIKIACLTGLEGFPSLFKSLENEFKQNKIEWEKLIFMEYGNENLLKPIKTFLSTCQDNFNKELSKQISLNTIPKNLNKYFHEAKIFENFLKNLFRI
ncbi:hypothetical protein Mgra_00002475 [Meloidogyne graminicola]|uniref:Uncharacterized protein n=1 Tax=Meloidogyne graminicola TaxID=189291 RepID=A0A8S9ZXK7_9BILA|nr:hypothetical protein Mgra_00002475 [Meloidogyne graminicola]